MINWWPLKVCPKELCALYTELLLTLEFSDDTGCISWGKLIQMITKIIADQAVAAAVGGAGAAANRGLPG
jgi:hypothetical protein